MENTESIQNPEAGELLSESSQSQEQDVKQAINDMLEGSGVTEEDMLSKMQVFTERLANEKPETLAQEAKIITEVFTPMESALLAAITNNNFLNAQQQINSMMVMAQMEQQMKPKNSGLILPR